jgi:endonuclease-3
VNKLESQLSRLYKFYGLLPTLPKEPFILFVWEVLSVHTTPLKRDAGMAAFKKLRALTPDAMWRTPHSKLEEILKNVGPYLDNRMENLRNGVDVFRRNRDLPTIIRGPLPAARRAIKPLPQLGETGAHRMLLFTADQIVMPVDARVSRVGRRLGYGEPHTQFAKTARSVREALCRELPSSIEVYRRAYVYLSHHGAMTCTEAVPHCTICPLLNECPDGKKRVRDGDVYTEAEG